MSYIFVVEDEFDIQELLKLSGRGRISGVLRL